jgi:NAD-dependent deacetylase
MKQKITVLSGAGMSADSGIKTFRDANGLWEGHDVTEVASPEGFAQNPDLVLNFYNQRRRQLLNVVPNPGHFALADLEKYYQVDIVTQNVDDLHERAGSTRVMHLHGELLKARSTGPKKTILNWQSDLNTSHTCPNGYPLRPHIVWFGEDVPLFPEAVKIVAQADLIIVVGTSLQVYPAASLLNNIRPNAHIFFIDPKPNIAPGAIKNLQIIHDRAISGVPTLVEFLKHKAGGYS